MPLINIKNFSLFDNVDESVFLNLFNDRSITEISSNTSLIEKNTQNDQVFILIEGSVDIYTDDLGKPVRTLNSGSVFGEISVLDAQPATASVIAKQPCKALILTENDIWQLCERSHAFTTNILKLVVQSTRRVSNQLNDSFENIKDIEKQARLDALTGLYNRRWLNENLPIIVSACQKNQTPLSYLMIDIDHFKVVNDTYGHDAGDAVLKQIGTILQTYARNSDAAVRYGGEEICLILLGLQLKDSIDVAERLRDAIEQNIFHYADDKTLTITASIGLATLLIDDSPESLMKRADTALYEAKNSGRNKVIAP